MALGRVKTWISEILTAADLNAEFNNILNNATSLISPATGAWDMDGKELILDVDADTSITADTDDQIDFRLGGVDTFRMTATGFSTLAGGTITSAGALTVTSGALTVTAGAINTARATVASAATTADIWAAAGNQIDYTGTVTCTGFPAAPQAGAERTLICAAAAVFTAGANMLIDGVASAANLTCAANDKVVVRAITTTQFMLSRVKYDGTSQVTGVGNAPTIQIFTASGTYTKPAGLVAAIVEVCGAGGGGGGGAATGAPYSWAGGGGGGSSSRRRLLASAIGATETVTIGAGGSAGTSAGGNGGTGGTSSLGALVNAPGGVGGDGAVSGSTSYPGGAGGAVGSAGDIFFVGGAGSDSSSTGTGSSNFTGKGGDSRYGGGGLAVNIWETAGNVGKQYGGGGSGGCGGASGFAGGAGFAGVIIVTEFY